jgi:hypothetical protein|tara:strand:+ start:1751 stop:2032 length:282 start_codon:yes stop_codon:yes gene_type:complete
MRLLLLLLLFPFEPPLLKLIIALSCSTLDLFKCPSSLWCFSKLTRTPSAHPNAIDFPSLFIDEVEFDRFSTLSLIIVDFYFEEEEDEEGASKN